MRTFIEDYLQDPAQAIAKAQQTISDSWYDNIDEDMIYAQINSPEFCLYETIVFSPFGNETDVRSRLYQ